MILLNKNKVALLLLEYFLQLIQKNKLLLATLIIGYDKLNLYLL